MAVFRPHLCWAYGSAPVYLLPLGTATLRLTSCDLFVVDRRSAPESGGNNSVGDGGVFVRFSGPVHALHARGHVPYQESHTRRDPTTLDHFRLNFAIGRRCMEKGARMFS